MLSRKSYLFHIIPLHWSTHEVEIHPRGQKTCLHDDVIKWKYFPRYWPFVWGEFSSQRPVTRGFDVFVELHLNKQLSKQSWRRWFETRLRSLWRNCGTHHHSDLTVSFQCLFELMTKNVKAPCLTKQGRCLQRSVSVSMSWWGHTTSSYGDHLGLPLRYH